MEAGYFLRLLDGTFKCLQSITNSTTWLALLLLLLLLLLAGGMALVLGLCGFSTYGSAATVRLWRPHRRSSCPYLA